MGLSLYGKTSYDCRYALPLAELGGDFYDELKSLSSGYASFDYAEGPTRRAELVRSCAKYFYLLPPVASHLIAAAACTHRQHGMLHVCL